MEAALSSHPSVGAAVVVASGEAKGDKQLIAYLVNKTDSSPSIEELRHYLRDRLPDYMIPAVFIKISSIPLTPNGRWIARRCQRRQGIAPR